MVPHDALQVRRPGHWDVDAGVRAAGPQQRGVHALGIVGGRDTTTPSRQRRRALLVDRRMMPVYQR